MVTKRQATIADVARRAGVSTATAGRVLGGYGYSSGEKRDLVLKAAEDLGYRPNQLARSLITGRTRTIGFVAGDIQSPFFAKILRGVSDVLEPKGFGLLITNSDETVEGEMESIRLLSEKQVDGVILSPCDVEEAAHLRKLVQTTPMVLIDRQVADLDVDSVGVDSVAAAEACVRRLIAEGHRRIGMVAELQFGPWTDIESFVRMVRTNPDGIGAIYPSWQRFMGYVRAHDACDLPLDLSLIARVNSYSTEDTKATVLRLLGHPDGPSVLFTADGLMTEGTMMAIFERGLRIPDDISLVAFDDLDWMSFIGPGIDSIGQPRRKMGEAAARMLIERIGGFDGPPRREKLPVRDNRRGSVCVLATGRD
ncbi:LacI family DNA-binding transcriptional regulator [Tropicimonas sp. IMCC6043]|uniref:LacI family DNA-binding transcriptional regulator n=1 Tax=Tropicimonas sp. IMCC6043 TaxID=2510645 RepID=UPI001F5D8FBF|nr:LacI family DNA-binding transcriptional regulator [Tropicimonas sp. IMCC6043]